MQTDFKYRPDVDGLRAVAVLAVLFYHAGFKGFSGGFVGVDVFFVISGYLIIGLISQQMDTGKFGLLEFYIRRARRLVPAIIPVLVFSLILAFFSLSNTGFQEFMNTFIGAGFFSSNYVFLAESGYFARETKYEILLHTWSLAVEWQFYLLVPFLILFAGPKLRIWLLLAISVLSFLLSVYLINEGRADRAFYSVFPRLWELGAGGLLALSGFRLALGKPQQIAVRLVGLVAIGLSATLYDPSMPFPGTLALLPVIGTLLLIVPARTNIISDILASAPMVWVGQLSYSLYLWHWPLIVAVHLYFPSPNEAVFAAALGLSLLLSALNYSYVENPVRRRVVLSGTRSFGTALILVAVLLGGMFALTQTQTFTELQTASRSTKFRAFGEFSEKLELEKIRYFAEVNRNFNGDSAPFDDASFDGHTCSYDLSNPTERVIECLQGLARENSILVAGDSHGRDFFHAIQRAFPEKHFVMLHQSSCAPVNYTKQPSNRDCFPDLSEVLAELRKTTGIRKVLLSARWDAKEPELVSTSLEAISGHGMRGLIIGPKPVLKKNVGKLVRNMAWDGIAITPETMLEPKLYREDIVSHEAKFSKYGNQVLAVSHLVCSDKGCPLMIDGGHPLFFDREHFTIPGIDFFAERLRTLPALQNFLGS